MGDEKSRKARQRPYSISELRKFDGKERRPAYIAFKGTVYDVSKSGLWKMGRHMDRHFAGDDLSSSMMNAPHGEEVFMKFPVVGQLIMEEPLRPRLVQRIERLHLHAIIVHFSIAYTLVVSFLVLLYLFTGEVSFETASYYLLVLGFLSGFPAGLSGLFSWKVTYEGRMIGIIARKIVLAAVLVGIISICFVWRTLIPDILSGKTVLSYIYLTLIWSLVPVVVLLGYYGGKISHP